jgi:23S rRNA pseudouridine1911/1915/1917 synthase
VKFDFTISEELSGQRLDSALHQLLPEYSRASCQGWIKTGDATLNGKSAKNSEKVKEGDEIHVTIIATEKTEDAPQNIALTVVYQDNDFIIINKPAGLVVHPAKGHDGGTLVNALLYHFPELKHLPRAGIIHRLDKDTTGLLIIGRNLESYTALVKMLAERAIKRDYYALVYGTVLSGGTINKPLGRHHSNPLKKAIRENGKEAITHYRVEKKFPHHTLLKVSLETGRTHQIRAHLESINHAIVGDPLYGRKQLPKGASDLLKKTLNDLSRQALHAFSLSFEHPMTKAPVEVTAPLPQDFEGLLSILTETT